jgi:putative hemolysin
MALRLAEHPGRFLSTVQIGITAVGVLSGALSGRPWASAWQAWLIGAGVDPEWAGTLGVGGVVVAITYVSLIVGELVPKQLALRNPEGVAIRVAPAMTCCRWSAAPGLASWTGRAGRCCGFWASAAPATTA